MLKLDVGCGSSKKKGFLGVDMLPFDNVDIVHDLSVFPWPFDDNTVDIINMDNVLEHLRDPIKTINELYRISKGGSEITITVPYFRSLYAFIDPTHVNFFSSFWFDYFDHSKFLCQKYAYSASHLRIISKSLNFSYAKYNLLGFFVKRFANKFPDSYEYRLSRIFPADFIVFKLKVIK